MTSLALLTQHGKEAAVQPALLRAGFAVQTVTGFDTDTLGTFTGETARAGSQLDAASAKARLATELTGERYGLGSEGSFGPDPYVGLTAWAREVLVWWDAPAKRAVVAVTQGASTNYAQSTVSDWAQAQEFAREAGFPEHGVIVGKPGATGFTKDCGDWTALEQRVRAALEHGPLWLETDMRAHRNPTRMAMIAQCAEALATLLQSHCPACRQPGFGEESPIPGALCETCGSATTALRAKRVTCTACGFSIEVALRSTIDASRCGYCNP